MLWKRSLWVWLSLEWQDWYSGLGSLPKLYKTNYECIFVHGNPIFRERRNLWSKILGLHSNGSRPWCCIGDVSEMLSIFETDGIWPQQQDMLDSFWDFLNKVDLLDLESKGCNYTWISNPWDGRVTRERIDRVLANWPWRSLFPHAIFVALPIITSYHTPIILYPKPKEKSGRCLRYEAFWEKHEACNSVTKEGWNKRESDDDPW